MATNESEFETSTASINPRKSGPFKVILLGASGVGKSSLFYRVQFNKFCEDIRGQQLDDFKKTIKVNNNSVEINLFDTAGMEYHERSLTRTYYLGSRVVLIVYSADDMNSVDVLEEYINDVNRHAPNAKKFLIRNKIDLEDQSVQREEVDAKLEKCGYSFKWKHEVSAKEGWGIDKLLKEIGTVILKHTKPISSEEKNSFQVYREKSDQKHRESSSSSSSCC